MKIIKQLLLLSIYEKREVSGLLWCPPMEKATVADQKNIPTELLTDPLCSSDKPAPFSEF